jgi:alpha-glucosidase
MPWAGAWDDAFLEQVRALVRLRRASGTLARGGIRWVAAEEDTISFVRETHEEQLLVIASRAPIDAVPGGFASLEPVYDSPQFQIWRIA